MAERGRFIVFEGGEATGKSTQAKLLAAALAARLTREPGGTNFGELLRTIVLSSGDEVAPRAELLLMVAARAQHVAEVIAPTLSAGIHVVCERFTASTLAYQGYGRGLPMDEVSTACSLATAGIEPDLVVLLDMPIDESTKRGSGPADRIERAGRAFHERVEAGYRDLAAGNATWAVVNASGPIEDVARQIRDIVAARLEIEISQTRVDR